MALVRSGVAAVALGVAGAGVAVAQAQGPGVRQTIVFGFDQDRPRTGTGVRIEIDYLNPDDPDAKPPAVQTVVETLAPGSRIDTSVPERCDASDTELIAAGAAACPAGSRVGGGEVALDTGIPGPGRIIETDVTEFNNTGEVILLFEPVEAGSTRFVSRAPIDGRTITAGAPPLPGGPPDGFTALKRVRLTLDAISTVAGGKTRSYVTTPRSCPVTGSWTNEISFTYRDGESQSATSDSPCVAANPGRRRRCRGQLATIVGTPGRDNLRGTPNRDVIAGLGADDTIRGSNGGDLICGGQGRDRLHGGKGSDSASGGRGSDSLFGGRGEDRLQGRRGDDVLRGRSAADDLRGGAGSDNCRGGRGNDRLRGCETANT